MVLRRRGGFHRHLQGLWKMSRMPSREGHIWVGYSWGGHSWGGLAALGADCGETRWAGVEIGGRGGGDTEFKSDSQVQEEEHFDHLTHHTPAQKSHRSEKGPLSGWTTNQLDEMSTALQILTPAWEVGHITSNLGARKPR